MAGSGAHSHEVPSRDGTVVWMGDGNHDGTSVFWSDRTEAWCSFDHQNLVASVWERILLVRGTDCDLAESGESLVAVDGESPDGLAFVGCGLNDDTELVLEQCGGEVLWDSEEKS